MTSETSVAARVALRRAARAAGQVERAVGRVAAPGRNIGFPYRAPTVPRGVEVPAEPPSLGADYDTDWARSPAARVARGVIAEGPMRLVVRGLADPEVFGVDRLDDLRRQADGRRGAAADLRPQPPQPRRHGADVPVGAVDVAPPARGRRGRRLLLRQALEGGAVGAVAERDPDRPGLDRAAVGRHDPRADRRGLEPRDLPRGRALARRLGPGLQGRRRVPVGPHRRAGRAGVPRRDGVDLRQGHEAAQGRGGPGSCSAPRCTRSTASRSRRFNARIQAAVTTLADEATTDWWTARRRAAAGTSPTLGGPDYTGWRRQWDLTDRRRAEHRRLAQAPRPVAGPTSADPTIWPDSRTIR